ncbi:MAG: excinuclease ABC subunit C [uncultured bacterium]|nr:MAG: excinuclease ABC subunit C [uncultured bacterium]OFW69015.1 MAG: endonuclease [Alphaproteobacteria bacterium GWC2_42_16]OFW73841.1 MAG: endonuclease [Alphaproteobacteria bacterium GWA2_41_27]OFW82184.1 MAG: endonuclease [Alphaproteobacteria bacterium RIFCSPHIGHO2_12_FULL_42_100]OFW86365.1 MAG: endonuclease [Alphaproteobacteria bacterium RBG_16_42_14]OFW91279.1 MAG: endonuclease [Alphaproteobacteria bacterium RIFCSPHIGHO2_02_FULL_42_30]OFW92215.1 MAG: endonuclease [Alphaproteobacteria 
MKNPAVYIMTNKRNGALYTGVTSNLIQRIFQHKNGITKGFTHRYNCKQLVYYELFADMERAILREKQIKAGSRKQKLKLIESINPEWFDLYESIL